MCHSSHEVVSLTHKIQTYLDSETVVVIFFYLL